MAGLVIVILNWTLHNIPNRHDLIWLSKAGGLFSKGVHPPARKFNAGQKMIFWGCYHIRPVDFGLGPVAAVPVRIADVRQDLRQS